MHWFSYNKALNWTSFHVYLIICDVTAAPGGTRSRRSLPWNYTISICQNSGCQRQWSQVPNQLCESCLYIISLTVDNMVHIYSKGPNSYLTTQKQILYSCSQFVSKIIIQIQKAFFSFLRKIFLERGFVLFEIYIVNIFLNIP